MENHIEKTAEHEMDTGTMQWLKGMASEYF